MDSAGTQIVRRITRTVQVGSVEMGRGNPIPIQSMLSCPADDVEQNIRQAKRLEEAGCQILRVAIPDKKAVGLIGKLKEAVTIPLVADIHFDYRLALEAAEAGADKIRINPGNIGDDDRVRQVANACRAHHVPIRIGVNSGSVEKGILAKYGSPTAEALVESALYHVRLLNRFDFDNVVISMKASDVPTMIRAYRLMADQTDYPLHLGVTHAGTERTGLIKSAIGIGALLCEGIGDTVRVSLAADPVREIAAAHDILRAVGIERSGVSIIACPTCGRTRIDLLSLVKKVEDRLGGLKKDMTIAVMGCAVNGPGEAREADLGIAGGDGCAVLFKKGEILYKVPEAEIVDALEREARKMAE